MKIKYALTGILSIFSLSCSLQVFAHGDVTPQAVNTEGLETLGEEWREVNPYVGNEKAIEIGASAYNSNCARCHGLEAVSGGIAPDLRALPNGPEGDDFYNQRVRGGAIRNGVTYMPKFEGVISQEALWTIRTWLESVSLETIDKQEQANPTKKASRQSGSMVDSSNSRQSGSMVDSSRQSGSMVESTNDSNATGTLHEIKMLNMGKDKQAMVFEPSSLKVAVGDRVKFIATDALHNSSSSFTPEGAKTWMGKMNEEITVTLDKEGIYIYKCDPHIVMGMVGVIQVGEATNKSAALEAAKKLSATLAMNKDRLEKYIDALDEGSTTNASKPEATPKAEVSQKADDTTKSKTAEDKQASNADQSKTNEENAENKQNSDAEESHLDKITQKGVLEIAVYKEFPPYSYVEKGQQKGIDVEIAKELAKRLSVSHSIRMVGADENVEDDLRNNVWKGHYLGGGVADVMLHMPVDRQFAEENDQVSLVSPYQLEKLAFAIDTKKLGKEPTLAIFTQSAIGVELDTLSDFYLLRALNGRIANNVRHFHNIPQAIEALRAGKITAIMAPQGELEGNLSDKPAHISIKHFPTPGLMRAHWAMGMAVKAKHKKLTAALNTAMATMVKDGTVKKIFTQYGVAYNPPAIAPQAKNDS